MLTAPLENSLIRMDEELKRGAVNVFILVLLCLHAAGKLQLPVLCWEISQTDAKKKKSPFFVLKRLFYVLPSCFHG